MASSTGPLDLPTSSAGEEGFVSMSMELSPEAAEMLWDLADAHGSDLGDVVAKALVLYKVATDAESEGKRLAVIDRESNVDFEITGI